ncbi:hypothetical protein TURU_007272 [Turdus rufiventris]|nr:hypothetical protein TURU_007272 [Turdus rufiventris]
MPKQSQGEAGTRVPDHNKPIREKLLAYPWVKVLLRVVVNGEICSFYRIKTEISRGADETPDLRVDSSVRNPEWCGKWKNMDQILREFSDPIVWDFPRKQIQNPTEVAKYLKKKCHDKSKEEKIIAVNWSLAYAYHTLLNTVEQEAEEKEQENKSTTIRVTQAAVNTPGSKPTAKPDSKPQPMAVATNTRSKKSTDKTNRSVNDNDDDEAGKGPSAPPDIKPGVKTTSTRSKANIESFSLKDLHSLKKDYTR